MRKQGPYLLYGKRLLDVCMAMFSLPVVLPVIVVMMVTVTIRNRVWPLHLSRRVGRNGATFMCLKIKTMHSKTPSLPSDRLLNPSGYLLAGGSFLRKSSLDELPQVLNILVGHMSFVGYRPSLETQETLNARRIETMVSLDRPGLTGLAQVNGRDDLGDEEKVEFEVDYAARLSLALDLQIMLATVAVVVTRVGVRH